MEKISCGSSALGIYNPRIVRLRCGSFDAGRRTRTPQILSLSMAEIGEHFKDLFHRIATPPQPRFRSHVGCKRLSVEIAVERAHVGI